MKKLTYGLVIFSIAGIISGLLVVGIFMQPNTSREPAYLGMIYIAFNILILFLYNLVRNIILIISSLYICLNITSVLFGFPFRGQDCIFLVMMFPLFLYSIIATFYLTRPKVKEQFK